MRARSDLIACFGFLILAAQACDSGGERPDLPSILPDGSGGNVSLGGDGSGVDAHVTLPFAVDHHFHATGHMGGADSEAVVSNPNGCLNRPLGAQGACHCFEYLGTEWLGLFWLNDYENWGEAPGLAVEPGVHRVTFYAASDPPGMPVTFFSGLNSAYEYGDTFSGELAPSLADEFPEEPYSIELTAAQYERGVLSGFGWVLGGGEPGRLFIDDIRWE